MELKIENPTEGQPLPTVVKWNFEELKKEVAQSLETYKGRVYTSSDIVMAKSDKANLNRLVTVLEEARKQKKKQYLEPYNKFESQIKEVIGLVREQSKAIDVQVKAYDERRKAEKLEEIHRIYNEHIDNLRSIVPYERLHDEKWLNITIPIKTVKKELQAKIDGIENDLQYLSSDDERYQSLMMVEYLKNFSLVDALQAKTSLKEQTERMAEYQEHKKSYNQEEKNKHR